MNKFHRYLLALLATCLSLGLTLCVAVGTVSAHAAVIASNPKAGTTITTAPATVQVTTAENMTIKPSEDNLFVYDPKGNVISVGDAKVDINNPMQMSVAIKPNTGNGVYVVRWMTKSADDGDPAEGAFYFTVNTSGATTGTVKTPAVSTTSSSSSTPIVPIVIASIIALIIGAGAGFGVGRNRSIPVSVPVAGSDAEVVQDSKETTPRT